MTTTGGLPAPLLWLSRSFENLLAVVVESCASCASCVSSVQLTSMLLFIELARFRVDSPTTRRLGILPMVLRMLPNLSEWVLLKLFDVPRENVSVNQTPTARATGLSRGRQPEEEIRRSWLLQALVKGWGFRRKLTSYNTQVNLCCRPVD